MQRSIWDFVGEPTTRQIYKDLLSRVRQGITARFPLCCDSATERRYLHMEVTPADSRCVDFRSVLVAIQPRPIQRIWDRRTIRNGTLLHACAWCKRVDAGGEWLQVEEALESLGLFELEQLPGLTHGICAMCRRAMQVVATKDNRVRP